MNPSTSTVTMKAMPHVITQWQSGQFPSRSFDNRLHARSHSSSNDFLKPVANVSRASRSGVRQTPSLSLLATPENERWDFGSIRHIRQYSSDVPTPTSAVESIFELPSGGPFDSPNSSTHSSYIAELEDTSPCAVQPKFAEFPKAVMPVATSHSSMEFKSAEITSRAVIKVVDETIAAIEDTNRKLLSRAVAAEEAAQALREQNSQLQSKLKHYSDRHRPKTAPSSPRKSLPQPSSPLPQSRRHRQMPSQIDPTPLSAFNATIDQLVLPQKPRNNNKPRPPPPYPPPRQITASTSTPISPPSHMDLAPRPPTGFHTPQTHRRPPPLPLISHSRSHSHLAISGPIPGSVTRHEVTLDGTPLSNSLRAKNISLEEARRRAKPLPPLGPMSPSVLRGIVEIGTPVGVDEWGRELREEKRRRGFSGLFRRRRDKETVF